jgi:outer membrane protein OmpA-like peptidoglycan-associated protein
MIAKRWLKLLSILALSLVAAAAGAVFWAELPCSSPSCARARYSLFVELDSFKEIESIPLELDGGGRTISARSILASGGIDVEIEPDDQTLPYDIESGPLDRADLYQYSLVWRNLAAPSRTDGQIYAMITPALVSDRGEPLFGLMFDGAGREGIAVAPRQTIRTFQKTSPDAIPALQLRTFMHELLHALNRRHLDAAQMHDGRLSLEAPTRCLVDRENGQWQLIEQPLLALSPATIRFFQTAPARDILPGSTNTPFEGLHTSTTECEDARANSYDALANTRWEFAKQRFFELVGIGSARAQEDELAPVEEAATEISLRIQAQSAPYPLGYPIAVRLMAKNEAEHPLRIKDRLAPTYGLVQVEYRPKGTEDWHAFQPLVWYEPADDAEALLQPGETTEQTAAIYFGDAGWTFGTPGEYELRATLRASEDSALTFSNVVPLRTEEPQNETEREVLELLLDSDGTLDSDIGRLLIFGGRIGDAESRAPLDQAVSQYPTTALGSALKLTIASQRLNPPIDPKTGERPTPSFSEAAALLEETCTDSGIAALKYEMLNRYAAEMPEQVADAAQSSAAAWEGKTAAGEVIPTYSDPNLKPTGSVHFCAKTSAVDPTVRTAVSTLAREIKATSATRIVLVGHSDAGGSCTKNNAVALKRAEAVKQLLTQNGFRRDIIQTVTLGKHRPLSFSDTEEDQLLNRRVEILIESEGDTEGEETETAEDEEVEPQADAEMEESQEPKRILPRCS